LFRLRRRVRNERAAPTTLMMSRLATSGPEAGLVFGGEFLFRSRQEILVTSGRAGIYKTLNGGQSWFAASAD